MSKFIFLFLLSFNCLADDTWTREDSYREAVYLTITAVDWNQTLQINSNGGYETNPILGSHPSDAKINTLIPAAMLAHYYIATLLPTEYRKAWQYSFIIIEASAVSNNLTTGIKVRF